MNLIPDDLYIVGFWLGALLQVSIAFLYRRQLAGLFDPLFLNAAYISFGAAGLILVYAVTRGGIFLVELGLLAVWLVFSGYGMRLRFYRRRAFGVGLKNNNFHSSMDISAFVVVLVIYVLYGAQILSSGILGLDSALIDNRFLVQEENKFQAYLFGAVGQLPAVVIFRMYPKLPLRWFIVAIFPFWIIQALTLSKTGFLFPVLAISLFYSLRIKNRFIARPRFGGQVAAIALLMLGVYCIFWFISAFVIGTDISPLAVLLNRLFSSFDGLVYLGEVPLEKVRNVSLMQWYLGPFLKVLGLFDQKYNAFNFVIAVEYFGQGEDFKGMLPNNNHVGELIVAYGMAMSFFVAAVTGTIYGYLFRISHEYVAKGGVFIIPAAFVVSAPLGFLIDGQGWFSALLSSSMLLIPVASLAWLLGFVNKLSRRLRISASTAQFQKG